MKKALKISAKVLAIFLSILFVVEILPTQIIADAYNAYAEQKQFVKDLIDNPADAAEKEKAEILYEVVDKRDEYTKVYKRADGTYTAAISKIPIHFEENGKWEEIDNSLEQKGNVLTNKSNAISVEFPTKLSESKEIKLENDGYEISFAVNDIDEANSTVKNSESKQKTEIEDFASKTTSAVTYNDVDDNTDIQYSVLSNGIKENIIVSDADDVKGTYSFDINIGELTYEKEANGRIILKDGETKFVIPAPVMYDSEFAYSYDIDVTVTDNVNGSITVIYSPSREWINNSDREFPITIDPAIIAPSGGDGNIVEDTMVAYSNVDSTQAESNFYDEGLLLLANAEIYPNETGISELYTRFMPAFFSSFNNNVVVTDAQYIIPGIAMGTKAYAKYLTTNVNFETVTYNNKPDTANSETIDYYTAPHQLGDDVDGIEYIHFNITKPLNEWLNGAPNYGFAIIPDENFVALGFANGTIGNESKSTIILIDYFFSDGYNDLYSYHSQDVGRAGVGYVNDYNQSLSFIRNDLSISGNIMPVSVDMIYNPAVFDYAMVSYGINSYSVYGNNWMPNYYRFVQYSEDSGNKQITYFTETGSEIDFISHMEDGNIVFTDSHADYIGDSGYTAEILETPENYNGDYLEYIQITRPDGYIERFNNNGNLISITNPDYSNQQINIYYTSVNSLLCIDYITDGVGRKFGFVYDDNTSHLTEIICKSANDTVIKAGDQTSDLKTRYTYDNDGNLSIVTFADGKSIHYTYDSNHRLISAENIDGYKVEYIYGTNNRIVNIAEKAYNNSTSTYESGGLLAYAVLSSTQIQITDGSNNKEIYQFNRSGKLMYVCDEHGKQISSGSNGGSEGFFIIPGLKGVNSSNLLKNGDFESLSGWTGSGVFSQYAFSNAISGSNVLKVDRTIETSARKSQSYETSLAGEYTFSAYVYSDGNTSNESNVLTLGMVACDESSEEIVDETINAVNINGEWQRYTITVNLPATVHDIEVYVELNNSQGTYYIDNAQLEYLGDASEYNLVNNGSFTDNNFALSNSATGIWYSSNNSNTVIVSDSIIGRTTKALRINGSVNNDNTVLQNIPINGNKGDVFSVGGWFKGVFVKSESNSALTDYLPSNMESMVNFTKDRYAQIEVSYQYEEEDENQVLQTLTDTVVIPFEQFISDWQFARDSFVLKGDTDQITVLFRYDKNVNDAYITDIQLNVDEDAIAFEDGDEEEDTEGTCHCTGCEEINCECDCENELLCNCIQCKRRSGATTEDTFGNVLTNTSFDGVYSIINSDTYTIDGNYIATSTDADENTVTYGYNTLNGCLDSITDARNHTTNYGYDAYGLLVSVSAVNSNNTTSSAAYTYTNDRLTAITHNGFSYNFNYDVWGQLIQVSVGSQPIVSYTYGTGANRNRLTYVIYHNTTGSETVYRYIYANGNVSQIKINGVTKFSFKYDIFGDTRQITATDSRIVKYTDGRTDILDFNDHYIYSSYTNDNGDLIEVIGNLTYTTTDYDTEYTQSTGVTVNKSDYAASDGRVVGTVTSLDWFGRTAQEVVKTESAVDDNASNSYAAITTSYGYPTYTGDKTSNRVSHIINRVTYGTDTATQTKFYGFSYDYDANGNITAEYRRGTSGSNTLLKSYYYDDLNQLIRVNEVGGSTYVYEYDNAGNITSKKEYLYTTDAVILDEPENVVNYTYDSVWKDRLAEIGNTLFTYDNIGNPTSIGSDTLTWEGRTLKSYTKGNKTYNYSYDENGMRHRKTVSVNNSVTETYNYVWSDGKLISQEYSDGNTSYAAKFVYGSNGVVQGFIYDDTTYLYVRNLQGDIVAIVDELGREAMKMSYDAWGKIRFSVGSLDDTVLFNIIKHLSPFTYRGYCYDTDIELYYLQSRYYSPEICRFINTDDTQIAIDTQGEILSVNLFAYCENNPINAMDPNGLVSTKTIVSVINKIISFAGKVVEFILSKWSVSSKKYLKMSSYGKTPDGIYTFVKNNKSKLTSLQNNLSSVAFFLGIVLEIVQLSSIISKSPTKLKAVAEVFFYGFIKIINFSVSKFAAWLITTICKPLKLAQKIIESVISSLVDMFFSSKYGNKIKQVYLGFIDPKSVSFNNYIYALFKGVAGCF